MSVIKTGRSRSCSFDPSSKASSDSRILQHDLTASSCNGRQTAPDQQVALLRHVAVGVLLQVTTLGEQLEGCLGFWLCMPLVRKGRASRPG